MYQLRFYHENFFVEIHEKFAQVVILDRPVSQEDLYGEIKEGLVDFHLFRLPNLKEDTDYMALVLGRHLANGHLTLKGIINLSIFIGGAAKTFLENTPLE
ncbi:MAG: hypothetical protein F6K41_15145 [Symploca sp. SIO3E6]|nr:hypothetical protein [Caldora sp. SIO3E6]